MFLKRFFLFMALVIGACGGAWGVDETEQCVAGRAWSQGTNGLAGKSAGVYIDEEQGMYADYIVYFRNNKTDIIETECKNSVIWMAGEIKDKQDGLRAILTFATADGTGNDATNKTLSQGRLDTVLNVLRETGVREDLLGCSKAQGGTDSAEVCANFYLGDAPWDDSNSHFERRAVYIFLIYNENPVGQSVNICNDTVRGALTALHGKLKGWESGVSVAQTKLQALIEFCDGGKTNATQDDVDDFENKLKALLGALPSDLGTVDDFKAELEDLNLQLKVARVQAIYAGLSTGGSVWKNTEGKFNSYRLMADSTGAVVLGTAGALLSSHLIKKAQVKEGFEDLQCTIGGQLVANWGDEFLPRVTFVQ